MSNDIRALQIQTEAAKSLALVCREIDRDDDQLLEDTIEGETDLKKIMAWVVRNIGEDEAHVVALIQYSKELATRIERLEARIDKKRAALAKAMEESDLKKVSLWNATLTLKINPPKAIIDEALLPSSVEVEGKAYQLQTERIEIKTDRRMVLDLLKQGVQITGAHLSNQPMSLSIRRS